MRTIATILYLACAAATAAGTNTATAWDGACAAVRAYEEGKTRAGLVRAEACVGAALGDPADRAAMESRLVALLESNATDDGKRFVCRQLALMGSGSSVPALAALLMDPDLAGMARYALEAIPDPAADVALLAALSAATGPEKAGILGSLGARRAEGAIGALTVAVSGSDEMLAGVAASALEKIGTGEALVVLTAAHAGGPALRKPRLAGCAMAVAHALLNRGDRGPAERAFVEFYQPAQSRTVRAAALQGLLAIDARERLPLVLEILCTEGHDLHGLAARLLRTMPASAGMPRVIAALPGMSPSAQALVLLAMAERRDRAALPAAQERLNSEDPHLAAAACAVLGASGGAEEVGELMAVLGNPDKAAGARKALEKLRGAGVDKAIVRTLAGQPSAVQKEGLRILVARNAVSAVPELLSLARTEPEETQTAICQAAGALALEVHLPALVALVMQARDAAGCAVAERALVAAVSRMKDPKRWSGTVLARYPEAGVLCRGALLRVLRVSGEPAVLELVRREQASKDAAVGDAAFRALADWPGNEPAAELLQAARDETNLARRVVAIRGVVRMGEQKAAISPDAGLVLLGGALKAAPRAEEKWLVLGALMNVPHIGALQLAQSCLEDPALVNEAGLAVVKIGGALGGTHPDLVRKAGEQVLAAGASDDVKKRARALLKKL